MSLPGKNSTCWELVAVLLIALGNPIVASLTMVFDGQNQSSYTTLTGNHIFYMVGYELVILGCFAFFLKGRGWMLTDLNLDFNWQLTLTGRLLAICSVFCTNIAYFALTAIGSKPPGSVLHLNLVDWRIFPLLAISIVNPVFEETIVVCYLMGVLLKPDNPTFAINASIGVRLLYHLYQGVGGVITIVPMGFLFSYYYYKRRKLWPLIFAHGIMDFVALISM